jgi:hypothetical protein
MFEGRSAEGLIYRNNVQTYGTYGIMGSSTGGAVDAFARYAPGAIFEGNVFLMTPASVKPATYTAPEGRPANLLLPAGAVGCDLSRIYR